MKNPVGYAIKEAMMLVAYWPKLGSPGENEGMYWTHGITFTVHGDPGERWFFLDGMHYWFDQDFFSIYGTRFETEAEAMEFGRAWLDERVALEIEFASEYKRSMKP